MAHGDRRTVEERVRLVEAWQSSGLTLQAFSDAHGVPKSSLSRWAVAFRQGRPVVASREAKAAAARAPMAPFSFREVGPPALAYLPRTGGPRLTLPNGIVVELPADVSPSYVADVIAALGEPC